MQLAEDASGAPGKVLESWNAPSPTQTLTTVFDTLNLQLYAGVQYWVIVRPFSYDVNDVWYDSLTGTNAVDVYQVFLEAGNPIPITGGWLPCASRPNLSCLFSQAFDVKGVPINWSFPPVGFGPNQYLRFIVQGPVTPAPGAPVEANLSFTDINGNAIGPSSVVTLNPGQTAALDLHASDYLEENGQHLEVIPVVTEVSNPNIPAPGPLRASVQVIDDFLSIATLLIAAPEWPNPAVLTYPATPIAPLVPQDLAGGQTMRLNVVAHAPSPCVATLGFADKNGNPLGGSVAVNLAPGTGTWLDLNSDALGLPLGRHIDVQPIVTVTAPAIGAAALNANSVCQASVEVFDRLTGGTSTYQTAAAQLPTVQ